MDRGAWQTIVHGVSRVGHDLATEPSLLPLYVYIRDTQKKKQKRITFRGE